MKLICILFISFAIFALTVLKSEGIKNKKVVICAALIAVLSFAGPYIVDCVTGEDKDKEEVDNVSETEENSEEHVHKTANIEKENIIEATCLNAGQYEEVSYCECGEVLGSKIMTIDALGHDFVNGICLRCGLVSQEQESLTASQPNELSDAGNYNDADSLIYTAQTVNFVTYSGSIEGDDQTDIYSLTAPVSGYYRFDLNDMVNRLYVNLYVYDSDGYKVGGYSGAENGQGITCQLDEGRTYSIKVMSDINTGNYKLSVGQQKEAVDATMKEAIYDSIEYTDQWNEYTFIPAISGVYRFDLDDMVNGFYVNLYVYDTLNYRTGGYSGADNGNGLTVKLEEGKTYTIKIGQDVNTGTYTLKIGKPKSVQDITGNNMFAGQIMYTDQDDEYIYMPSSTGEHTFTLNNMVNGFNVTMCIYDALGYRIGGYSGAGNGDVITAKMKAGEIYTIHLIQDINVGSYEVSISK